MLMKTIKEIKVFLTEIAPQLVSSLKGDEKPIFGVMTTPEMIEHLCQAYELTKDQQMDVEIVTPEENLEAYRQFLLSDKQIRFGAKKPYLYDLGTKLDLDNLAEIKKNFTDKAIDFIKYVEANPEKTSIHPTFGELKGDLLYIFHYKHITHHLKQFSLIEESAPI